MAGLSDTLQGDIQIRMGLFSGRKARRVREALQGYLFILPATIILVLFHFLPVLYAFYISLHKWFIVKGDYVGFANYTRALTTDRFWNSLKVTLWYVVGTVPIQLLLALVIAYLLFQKIRGKEGLRMVYFLPYVTSTVASGAVFAKMFNPTFGPINKALDAIGLPVLRWMKEPRGIFTVLGEMWGINVPFGGPSVALVTVMFFVIWFWVGYDATIFLAGLGAIPYELYEAAKIDGAGRWQLFRYITIPLLSPTSDRRHRFVQSIQPRLHHGCRVGHGNRRATAHDNYRLHPDLQQRLWHAHLRLCIGHVFLVVRSYPDRLHAAELHRQQASALQLGR
jgi:ABC-type sugar transport system permease subunit